MYMKRLVLTAIGILFLALICLQGLNCSQTGNRLQSDSEWSEGVSAFDSESTYLQESSLEEGKDVEEFGVNASDTVLICKSKSAYAYHSHQCQGLKRCKSGIGSLTKKEAVNAGYKPCGFCY